jgi:hypothetical protein
MKHLKFASLSILLVLIACNPGIENRLPLQQPLLNGRIEANEWTDSQVLKLDHGFEIFIKRDKHYTYLAVKSTSGLPFYVDLFLSFNDSLYNIHASTQLGERKLETANWDDNNPVTHWGYINDWFANTVLFDKIKLKRLREENFEGNLALETIIPYTGFEFQFANRSWDFCNAKIRLEIRDMVGLDGFEEVVFPKESTRMDHGQWHVMELPNCY